MSKILLFIKKEIVFCISATAAIVTCFFVHPSAEYVHYIDWNTLALLFSLMTVVAGLQRCGVFIALGNLLCKKVKSVRSLCGVLVLLCFVLSMFVTNDVSLITFVPFAITLLVSLGVSGKYVMLTVILQTVAANCGSMLTPVGNPQNLFLYGKMNCGLWNFMKILAPYTVISFLILIAILFFIPRTRLSFPVEKKDNPQVFEGRPSSVTTVRTVLYVILFITSILSVLSIIPKWSAAAATCIVVLAADPKSFISVDYMLLLTFVAFFIFTGNIQHLSAVKVMLEHFVQGNECIAAVAASQIISNVPAALLLFPFSGDVSGLLCGVDIGGLGTLVASLASLISFKIYSGRGDGFSQNKLPSPSKYLLVFTIINIIFLSFLLAWYFLVPAA